MLQKNGFFLSDLQIPSSKIVSGGPVKNGIPALNYPTFIKVEDVDFLLPNDQVLGITINGKSKAYPHNYPKVYNLKSPLS